MDLYPTQQHGGIFLDFAMIEALGEGLEGVTPASLSSQYGPQLIVHNIVGHARLTGPYAGFVLVAVSVGERSE